LFSRKPHIAICTNGGGAKLIKGLFINTIVDIVDKLGISGIAYVMSMTAKEDGFSLSNLKGRRK